MNRLKTGVINAIFEYGEAETNYLKERDGELGAAINAIGHIRRDVFGDFFAALVSLIVGQQISAKAQKTVWRRMADMLGEITPQSVIACQEAEIQKCGVTFKKASYIRGAAEMIAGGRLDISALTQKSDAEVRAELTKIGGVGVWTADMLMLFAMRRPDILSFEDLAIRRGMRMLYRHETLPREIFGDHKRRYSPHGSVASLYLWAIAGGANFRA